MSNFSLVNTGSLPTVKSSESNFFNYLKEINKFPMLSAEEEQEYAKRYLENGDNYAAQMLVQSHLRLVVKIASKYKNYGLPVVDLVSEGNLGLIQAVKKFEPEKGFRFSTYAMWWIKAQIQEYILKSWSLVKIGTTVAQKKLFFNLRKIKKKLKANDDGNLCEKHIDQISNELNVSKSEVISMNNRLQNSDGSLNVRISDDSEIEAIDQIESHYDNQEDIAIKNQEKNNGEFLIRESIKKLNKREQEIVAARRLGDKSKTLEELSKVYRISRERIRQIESNALSKMRSEILRLQKA